MKKFIAGLFMLALLALPVKALPFYFTMQNNTDAVQIYNIWWMDAPKEPMIIAGGELQPGKERTIDTDYKAGYYRVIWLKTVKYKEMYMLFNVQGNVHKVIVDREGIKRLIKS